MIYRVILLAAISLLVSSCGYMDKGLASLTGYSNVCVEGVNYLQFPSGVTVQYNENGKVVSCK